jgi:predicted dehydrogenase
VTATEPAPVRIGVVGAGFMGSQHIALVRSSPRAELVAIVDPAADGASFPCPVFADTSDMLASVGLDAVIIANPNSLHVRTAIACLEAGLAVLVEKPMAVDYAEARRLADVVTRKRARLLVGHHRRHHPSIAPAREALASGRLGRLVAVSGLWSARKDDAYFTHIPWHRSAGGGVTLINLVHDLDLMRHLCGEVTQVQAMMSSAARDLEVEDTVSVNLRFAGGAVGSFLASDAGVSPWGWDQSTQDTEQFPYTPDGIAYHLVGTRGALAVPSLALHTYQPGVAADWHSPLARTYLPARPGVSFQAQLDHFVDVARGTVDPLVTAEDAARTIALVEATALAARTSVTVDVSHVTGTDAERLP